jgi:hypothetical protein
MRKSLIALVLLSSLVRCGAQAAATDKPDEPTAIGVVYRLDSTSQELKKLTEEPGSEAMRQCGFGKACDTVELSGESSSLRIKADDKLTFVFKTGNPEKVSLYRFDLKKKKRSFVVAKLAPGTMGGSQEFRGLPVEVSQYGSSSYKLVPTSPLTPGEYAIMIAGVLYTFGIDQ